MLGTHSEPRRGQMSHICDISPLRAKRFSLHKPFFEQLIQHHMMWACPLI